MHRIMTFLGRTKRITAGSNVLLSITPLYRHLQSTLSFDNQEESASINEINVLTGPLQADDDELMTLPTSKNLPHGHRSCTLEGTHNRGAGNISKSMHGHHQVSLAQRSLGGRNAPHANSICIAHAHSLRLVVSIPCLKLGSRVASLLFSSLTLLYRSNSHGQAIDKRYLAPRFKIFCLSETVAFHTSPSLHVNLKDYCELVWRHDSQRGAVAAIKLQKPMPKMIQNNQNVVFINVMANAQKTRPTKLDASCSDSAFPMLAPRESSRAPSADNSACQIATALLHFLQQPLLVIKLLLITFSCLSRRTWKP